MTSCLCPSCSETPEHTWTPEFRLECEARYLLGLPLKVRQDALIHPARSMRRKSLEDEIKRQWAESRAA